MAATRSRPRPIVLGSASPRLARRSTTTTKARKAQTARLCTRATVTTANGSRSAASSPLWGPLPVTKVPVSSTIPAVATSARDRRSSWGVAIGRRSPSGSLALWCSTTALATSTAERR